MDIHFVRGLTLQEALEIAYADDLDVDQVYIQPPEANVLTDEESGDDENECDINRLSGRQLSARAEIVLSNSERTGAEDDDGDRVEETKNCPGTSSDKSIRVSVDKNYSWIQGDFEAQKKDFPSPDYNAYANMSPVELLELFFDSEVIKIVVTVASNSYGISPMNQVKRYSRKDKKHIQVSRPFVIGEYNSGMGGTDLMDGGRKSGKAISQLDFRGEIVNVYLTRYGNAPKRVGRPSTSKNSITLNRISGDLRYDRQDHLLVEIPEKKKRICADEGCCFIIRTMCKKFNVGLCLP
ncbi:hypothetical protein NQ314_009485 [Rhamnusium bicolor]|uniref:Transposase n=1 Tax=Rhamnusium bicolor TaxID=1586634 RepID=A0AAV8XZ25_9CUCU|nr:hypothetical protein NQ314_009485 [Rhamnusium bicolor]